MPVTVKRLEDVTTLPHDALRTSSEQGLHSPTDTLSTTKGDLESGVESESPTKLMTSPQFPEGGRQAWLTVLGGYVQLIVLV